MSNVTALKTTVRSTARCLFPFMPIMEKPLVQHGPDLAALQSPCLQQTLCKWAKLPEIQLQDVSFNSKLFKISSNTSFCSEELKHV